jgi:hypothetical protein
MLKFDFKILTTDLGKDARKWADARAKDMRKALSLAISKVCFKLYQDARQDLKMGRLGLKPKSRYRNRGVRVRKGHQVYMKLDKRYRPPRGKSAFVPLARLFSGITYDTNWRQFVGGHQKYAHWQVGFLGLSPGTEWQARLAAKSAGGYQWLYPPHAREYLREMGIHLRAATRHGKVPPRDIMGAVRKKYPVRMLLTNIKTLFDRKMAGERI